MAKKKKKDQLGFTGLVSAIARGIARERSLAKARDIHRHDTGTVPPEPAKPPKRKKPKDTRSAEEIRREVDVTRARLVGTVGAIKYDLDLPARARDARDAVAARIPREWKGEPRATIVAASVLATGLGGIVLAALAKIRRGQ